MEARSKKSGSAALGGRQARSHAPFRPVAGARAAQRGLKGHGGSAWAKVFGLRALSTLILLAGMTIGAHAQSKLPPCPTDQTKAYDNCFGIFIFPSGGRYVGEFKDDKRNGQGTYIFPSGGKYVGEFKDDKINGQGTHIFSNGEKYVGEFKDDKRNGQGTYIFPGGGKYVGEFKDDKINGLGTFTFPNGEKYVGEHKNGFFDGEGVMYAGDGRVLSSGIWEKNKLVKSIDFSAGRRIALVIGNAAYSGLPRLGNPLRDAKAIADALRQVGFSDVIEASDLSRDGMLAALNAFSDKVADADWALVYYAGHGVEVDGINYLIPVDAKLRSDRDVADEAVSLNRVLNGLSSTRKLRLVVLDACRDNPFEAHMRRTVGTRSVTRGLAPIEPGSSTLVVYAAKHGQVSQDGSGQNSPFASALTRYMTTPGLEIDKMFRKVAADVLSATDNKQEPFTYGRLPPDDLYFAAQ